MTTRYRKRPVEVEAFPMTDFELAQEMMRKACMDILIERIAQLDHDAKRYEMARWPDARYEALACRREGGELWHFVEAMRAIPIAREEPGGDA